eukprot:428455-Rhodomonas_salina.1
MSRVCRQTTRSGVAASETICAPESGLTRHLLPKRHRTPLQLNAPAEVQPDPIPGPIKPYPSFPTLPPAPPPLPFIPILPTPFLLALLLLPRAATSWQI